MPACLRHLQRPMPTADPVIMLRVPTRQRIDCLIETLGVSRWPLSSPLGHS
jgi:hypothetical protein